MRLIRVPVALLLTCSMPGVALAQVPPPPSSAAPTPTPTAEPAPAPVAPVAPTEETEEQKAQKAKEKYVEAEGLFNAGRYAESVPLYEEAYYLVPGKHGFAYKVGIAAWNASDCDKANTYLKHFLQYGDPEKYADKINESKQILGEISVSGCATPTPTTTTTTTTNEVEDTENPLGESSTDMRHGEAKKAREDKKAEKRGLLTGGAVLAGFGVAGLAVGFIGLGMASGSAGTLRDLSSNQTNSGFPVGDYSCFDLPKSECPYDLEKRLATGNTLAYIGLGVGGAALAAGAAMLAIYFVNKKKNGGAVEAETDPSLSSIGPMMLPGGAGAAAEIRF